MPCDVGGILCHVMRYPMPRDMVARAVVIQAEGGTNLLSCLSFSVTLTVVVSHLGGHSLQPFSLHDLSHRFVPHHTA